MAALMSLIAVAFGVALLQMFLALIELDAMRTMLSVAVWLLAFVTVLASLLPSIVAGLIFALAAVYGGINMIWMAWLAAAVAVAGFVVFGMLVVPSESSAGVFPGGWVAPPAPAPSPVLPPRAIISASLCWWLAKPLHRASIAA